MHDIVTGHFQPNDADTDAGIMGGFGSTINIINGGDECGWASPSAAKRGQWYQAFLSHFGITDNSGNDGCESESAFPYGSAG
jgi:hypothetical protein